MEFLNSDIFLIFILAINILLIIMVIISSVRIKKINDSSKEFMRKLGNGRDIREDLEQYMERVINLEAGISETNSHCNQIDKQLKGCIQKVGVVRYNAYRDSGSNLSFAVALLDENNDGVVFNGIYSREMSNIYAKPVNKGKSSYTMTEEEAEAVLRAMGNDGIQRIN